ncbi:MAG: DNA resolvase [Bacteroidetes bacterium B1(2017)]|nr:MAG: DNA resolvase [Bacteroidetes bacterium B1(2017)]
MNVVLYCRTSTVGQDYAYQLQDLEKYAAANRWNVCRTFAEHISGAKTVSERKELSSLIAYVKNNNINKVIVTELSRLGRNTLETLQTIELFNQHNISLLIKNSGIETLNTNGEVNVMAKFMLTLLAEIATMERVQIRQRMKSGYDYYISTGGLVGRQKGYKKTDEKYLAEYAGVVKLLKKEYPVRKIATLEKVSVNTVQKVKRMIVAA